MGVFQRMTFEACNSKQVLIMILGKQLRHFYEYYITVTFWFKKVGNVKWSLYEEVMVVQTCRCHIRNP